MPDEVCPHLDAADVCTICCRECHFQHYRRCSVYQREDERLLLVLRECLFASRRAKEPRVWCRAGAEPAQCLAWPSDCPTYWKHRALAAAAALQALGQERPVPSEAG